MDVAAEADRPAGVPAPSHRVVGKLMGVEALRGVAALLVVLFHAGTLLSGAKDYGMLPLGGAFGFGRAGVDVFFVLSGFIITYIHAADVGRPSRLVSFARKRLLRIYPSYWIATLILLAIMLVSPTPDRREHHPLFVLSSLLLLPAQAEPLLGPGWSLRHELLFYGLFAAALLNRHAGLALLSLWFAAVAANVATLLATGFPLAGGIIGAWLLAPINLEFLAGIAVARLLLAGRTRHPAATLAAGLALFCLTALFEAAGPALPKDWLPVHAAYAFAAFLILLGAVTLEQARGLRVPAFLVRLGDASYALYLLHVIVIMLCVFCLRHLRPFTAVPLDIAFVGVVAASALVALAFTSRVERPLLERLRRLLSPPRAARQPASR